MNINRIFGALLTMFGIAGLFYTVIMFVNNAGDSRDIRSLVTFGILGFVFFISGINMVRIKKEEA